MSKFKIGDKVVTDEGETGTISDFFHCSNEKRYFYPVTIKNRRMYFYEDGLRLAEEEEEEVEMLPCKRCEICPEITNGIFTPRSLIFKCLCLRIFFYCSRESCIKEWNENFGKKKRELKKGDVVYIKAIIRKSEVDKNEDIECYYARNPDYYSTAYVNEKEVFTLDELKQRK